MVEPSYVDTLAAIVTRNRKSSSVDRTDSNFPAVSVFSINHERVGSQAPYTVNAVHIDADRRQANNRLDKIRVVVIWFKN